MDEVMITCPVCGKRFRKTYTNRVACSDDCKVARMRESRKRYYQKCAERIWSMDNPGVPYKGRLRDPVIGDIPHPKPKEHKYHPGAFDAKLKELKAQGLDYIEEQKRQTIEMYGRIKL